jgi:hypothetical protein
MIEQNLIELYNSSVSHLSVVNALVGVQNSPQNPPQIIESFSTHQPLQNQKQKDTSDLKKQTNPEESKQDLLRLQLKYILNSLVKLYPHRTDYFTHFNAARVQLQNGNIDEAAKSVENILFDDSLDDSFKNLHNKIVEDARSMTFN